MTSLFGGATSAETARAWLYVGIQLGLLVAMVVLPSGEAWPVPAWLAAAGRIGQLAGVAVLVVALVNLGPSLTPLPTPTPTSTLRRGGLYRLVRHPIYSGILLLAFATASVSASWWVLAAAAGLAVLFQVKSGFEERLLRRRYPEYAAYADRTGRFVPVPRRRGR
jgi:protein-S-isoprenylcysteine O-methyltransferase Ste14